MKKRWVNPDCQNSEPTKRTVSISALDAEVQTKMTEIFFYFIFSLKILLDYCQTLGLSPSWTLYAQYGGPEEPKPLQNPPNGQV